MDQIKRNRLSVLAGHLISNTQISISPHQTCGIIAVVAQEPVPNILMECLRILEARGYDSAGISTVNKIGDLHTTKYASKSSTNDAIELVSKDLSNHHESCVGIAHTRWATHGGATDNNSHPHLDQDGRIAVVHNGIIENYASLKSYLKENHNIIFQSDTDTEVIAQMIGLFVRQGQNIFEAVKMTLEKLRGTWGLVILDRKNPESLIVAKNGSPMLIGIDKDKTFVSSESVAFGKYTKKFIELEDNEIVVLTSRFNSSEISRIRTSEVQEIITSPSPFTHWTLKEIMEQPESLFRALNYGSRLTEDDSSILYELSSNSEYIGGIKHLLIAACGTSLFAGMLGSYFMCQLGSFDTVQIIDAAELEEFHLPSPIHGGLLVISQSGETKDVHRALMLAKNIGIPCFSIINAVNSLIAMSTQCSIYLNAGRENAVASTKAFSSQVTILALVSLWFSKRAVHTNSEEENFKIRRREMVDRLHRLPTSIGMTTSIDIRKQCYDIASKLHETNCQNIFVLGKGTCMPIAYEGALKIKEISYIHAEGYSGGALKHGPFALINQGTPIIFIITDDQHASKMKISVEEIHARGAFPITITDIPNIWKNYTKDMGHVIYIPSNGILTSLLAVVPLQFIAYELSLLRGINPDRPRHLAKTVTVD